MTWIRVDDDVIDHPKTYRLARLLGADRTTAFGLLVAVWGYAARHHVDGDLTEIELAALHRRIDWLPEVSAGRPQDVRYDIRTVLVDAGWADKDLQSGQNVRIVLHDWDEHQGKLADRRAKDRERKRLDREREKKTVRRTSAPTVRNGTLRTTTTTAREDLVSQLTPEGREVFASILRANQSPEAVVGECRMILAGERNIKPHPTPAGLSLALTDLRTNGVRPTARSLRTYTADAMRQLTDGISTQRGGGESTLEAFDKAIADAKEREAAR